MIHLIGYLALALNLISMSMKNMLRLRVLSMIANFIYLIYGIVLNAPPFIIGCGIAIIIHGFNIFKLITQNNTDFSESEKYNRGIF